MPDSRVASEGQRTSDGGCVCPLSAARQSPLRLRAIAITRSVRKGDESSRPRSMRSEGTAHSRPLPLCTGRAGQLSSSRTRCVGGPGPGLRVRVLIDALEGIQIEDGIVEAMEDWGVDVHWYREPWLNSPFKQNHRGHRKVCVIDATIGFTGGMGIAKEWGGGRPQQRMSGATRISEWKGQRSTAWPRPSSRTGPRPRSPSTTSAIVSLTSRTLAAAAIQVVRGSASIGWNDIRTVWYALHSLRSTPDPVADRVFLTRLGPDRRAHGGCQPRGRSGHPAAGPER